MLDIKEYIIQRNFKENYKYKYTLNDVVKLLENNDIYIHKTRLMSICIYNNIGRVFLKHGKYKRKFNKFQVDYILEIMKK